MYIGLYELTVAMLLMLGVLLVLCLIVIKDLNTIEQRRKRYGFFAELA
jgi:hypothetical protein